MGRVVSEDSSAGPQVKNEAFRRTNRSRRRLRFTIRGVDYGVERVSQTSPAVKVIRGYSAQRDTLYARMQNVMHVLCTLFNI